MKRYRITLENHTFDVEVLDDPRREQVRVQVDGEVFTVGVEAAPAVAGGTITKVTADEVAPAIVPSPATPVFGGPSNTVAAPLPGVIKSIGVRPGQQVAADDQLLVIEAMKMDNIIRAPREGTIGTIHVAEGHQVAYGETLLEFVD
ncbi:MAG: biotin/lipoyl-containing protein [Chloroflexota bacterium]|nr:biotin/lipoyl-containing protein [Chloroflexota bacterium]